MTDEEVDRLIDYANKAYRSATSGENIGLVAWTDRVMSAMTFIPTLIAMIAQLRIELAVSKAKEGGHLETIISGSQTVTTCSTCRHSVRNDTADLRQVERSGQVAASAGD